MQLPNLEHGNKIINGKAKNIQVATFLLTTAVAGIMLYSLFLNIKTNRMVIKNLKEDKKTPLIT